MQLVSESVKGKQAQGVLFSEKQALAKQLQRAHSTLESLKVRIAQGEEQVRFCFGTSSVNVIIVYPHNGEEICSSKFISMRL